MLENRVDKYHASQNFEFGLVDCVCLLKKHRKLFIAILVLTTLLGVAASFLLPKQYTYTRDIQMGSFLKVVDDLEYLYEYIPTPEVAIASIGGRYLPAAWETLHKQNPSIGATPRIQVKLSSTKPGVVSLVARATEKEALFYDQAFQIILENMRMDYDSIILRQKKLLEANLSVLQEELAIAVKYRHFLLNNSDVSLRTVVIQPLDELRLKVQRLKLNLSTLEPLHFTDDFARSAAPVGLKPRSMIVFSIFLGIFLGMLGIFCAEMLVRIRNRS